MKKLSLLFHLLFCALFTQAQSLKTFKIDYTFAIDDSLLNIDIDNEQDELKKALAMTASLASVFQDENKPIAQAWVSKDYIRVDNSLLGESYQITNKTNNESYIVYPSLKQYASAPAIGDKLIENENSFNLLSDYPVELVEAEEKIIAGYKCKLAKIRIDDEETRKIDVIIWYTEDIPKLYWGEYAYLEKLPGAALYINTMGIGLLASNVTEETLHENFFKLPEDDDYINSDTYSDNEASEYVQGLDFQIADDRIAYFDTTLNLYGLKDMDNNIILKAKYSHISYENDDILVVTNNDGLNGVIDNNGKERIPAIYTLLLYDGTNNLFMYLENEKCGFMDETGKIIIPAKYDQLAFFNGDYAIFAQNESYGIINRKEEIIVPPTYHYITEVIGNHFVVNDEYYKSTLYSLKSNKKVSEKFNSIMKSGLNELFIVENDNKFGLMDASGKVITPIDFTFISEFENGVAKASKDKLLEEVFDIDTKGKRIN